MTTTPSPDDQSIDPDKAAFRGDDAALSTAILDAVADTHERARGELPPLHDAVDVDAIHALVSTPGGGVAVSFPYAGVRVSVQSSGRVEVQTDAGEGGGDPEGLGTDADLQSRLQGLLVAAHRRGIRVRGGWDIRNERRFPDWDIHITEVVKPDTRGRSHDG